MMMMIRGRDGGANFILRIKEQETRLTLQEHDDDDDDDDVDVERGFSPPCLYKNNGAAIRFGDRQTDRQSALKTDFTECSRFPRSSCGFSALHNARF